MPVVKKCLHAYVHVCEMCDQIYHVVQELLLFSLHVIANRRTKGPTHIVIIVQTQGWYCNADEKY